MIIQNITVSWKMRNNNIFVSFVETSITDVFIGAQKDEGKPSFYQIVKFSTK
jgi:hypothetical protein